MCELKVAIIAGGLSHERTVSRKSGRRVAQVLRDRGFDVRVFDQNSELIDNLRSYEPDVAWPLVHGEKGEDGSLQDLLTMLGIRFVGTRAPGCRLASNKSVAKALLLHRGVDVPESVSLPQVMFRELGAKALVDLIGDHVGLPLIIKPQVGGSALGVTEVDHAPELGSALVGAFAYDSNAIAERFIEGTEIAVGVLGYRVAQELAAIKEGAKAQEQSQPSDKNGGDPQASMEATEPVALAPVEIHCDGPYDYDARYYPGKSEFFVPARLSEEVAQRVSQTAVAVFRSLGLRHYARIDIIVDSQGVPWVIDINVAPGMTETSLFPLALGIAVPAAYEALVRAAAGSQL